MTIFEDIDPIQEYLFPFRSNRKKIGFVPTMGALHKGHLSLIQASKQENDVTICSIYINPTQFNNSSDLSNYPRVLQKDIELLNDCECDALFLPSDQVMYPQQPLLQISFGELEKVMEGKYRAGHFNGVALVVSKFFNIINPSNVYFGQKDLQQFLIVEKLIKDLSFQLNLKCLPIVREPDGLAMSSRNSRLSNNERYLATSLFKALSLAQNFLLEENNVEKAKFIVDEFFQAIPEIHLEYFEVMDSESLVPVTNLDRSREVSLFIAGYLGKVRLIDNIFLYQK